LLIIPVTQFSLSDPDLHSTIVAARGRRGAIANAGIAQANAGINVGVAGVDVVAVPAGPPPFPNVIAIQPPGLPPLTPLEEAFTEIGNSANAARMLTSPNDQNITLPSLGLIYNAEVKTLCATMRKPRGGEQGTNVATRAEVSLKTVCYMARHYRCTSQVMVPGDLTFDNVVTFLNHCKSKVDYKEPSEKLKFVKVEKMLDFIEEWPEQLALINGQGGRLLAYVIRDVIVPPESNENPPFTEEESAYGSIRDKIQERSPHEHMLIAWRMQLFSGCLTLQLLNTRKSRHGSSHLQFERMVAQHG
jgi:hypothetical protein